MQRWGMSLRQGGRLWGGEAGISGEDGVYLWSGAYRSSLGPA